MKIERVFTKDVKEFTDVFSAPLEWKSFDVVLKDHRSDKVLFCLKGIEAPAHWSQQAVDIMSSKYFRRAEVPTKTKKKQDKRDKETPEWLWPSVPEKDSEFRCENSVKQVIHRLAGAWTYWGWRSDMFVKDGEKTLTRQQQEESAKVFYDEVVYMLYHQYGAPNSPQFFNTGINWAYGITGTPCGHWYADKDGKLSESEDLYTRSQAHACFILKIEDNLLGKNGIYETLMKEARIFKLGSGAGINYSRLRAEGEPISGGGASSGLMSFLKIFDRSADCIKSGGVCLCEDVKVPTEEGVFTIKQLADVGSSPRIYSWDNDTQQVVLRPVREVFKSKDKECVEVTFEDGQVYRTSFDHPFLCDDNTYVQASALVNFAGIGRRCRAFGQQEYVFVRLVARVGVRPVYNLTVNAEKEEDQNFAIVY